MKQMGLSYFTDIHLTVLALGIFLLVFLGVFAHVWRKDRIPYYDKMSKLPLRETTGNEAVNE